MESQEIERLRESPQPLSQSKEVFRGAEFDFDFAAFVVDPKHEAVLEQLRRKRFTLGRSDVGSRVVNHWESEGIVEDPRDENKGWRRYSISELVWLGALLELRTFGVPTETLRAAKRNIHATPFDRANMGRLPRLFEFYIVRALRRVPVYLLVFSDGEVELATKQEYIAGGLMSDLANHVRINMNELVQKTLPDLDLTPIHRAAVVLSRKETRIMLALRNGEHERVSVQFKNGEPDTLEVERNGEGKSIHELIGEGSFSDLTVKRRDGQIVHMSQILKEKL